MAMLPLHEPIEVQAQTLDGKPVPMQVLWKRQFYHVAKVERRKTKKQKGRPVAEEITISTIVWRKMKIEFDYQTRKWHLLGLEEI